MWFYSPCQLRDVELFGKGKPKVYFYIKLLSLFACLFVCPIVTQNPWTDLPQNFYANRSRDLLFRHTNTLTEITTLYIEKSVQCTVYTVQQKNEHIYHNH